ncbi:flagellar hook-basal body complex protein [Polynucleobacter sp. 73C-SIWE]|uniref:flagellar hook-basal body complex protein n=1 Tax=Polynucleobacter sp. 73C-SIWE TaxID=2689098 RepID=UPI001C0AF276|nr:flagellar hook-basal body complex protein [Polynucleobacter sp. 73C-SIWE]MBU3580215.1 flagellar hook-basal body complex protein [Polynucleobacter sp. 73C-SIWE]
MAFETGLSGLQAASENLSVLGKNIANVTTYGYKSASTDFSNVLATHLNAANAGAGSQTGDGVMISNIKQSFTQGSVTSTNSSLDAAISGPGFFITYDDALELTSYTRNGHFFQNSENFLVNSSGQYVMGYTAATDGTVTATGTPAEIDLSTYDINPDTATRVYEEDTITFYPLQADGYVTLGGLTFTNTSGSQISTIDLADIFYNYANDGTTSDYGDFSGTLGNYTFAEPDGDGTLVATGTGDEDSTILVDLWSPIGGLPPDVEVTVEGVTTAYLADFSIGSDGIITGIYTDGSTFDIAQLALATFANNNGLRSQGNVSWYETAASGEPTIGVAGSEGVGTLTGSSLEASNTDQTGDMVKLLAAQQAYQANAQTIKIENQNYQTLIAMGG